MIIRTTLFAAAQLAQKNSYSPFSGFKIGSAVLWNNEAITSGCNIENASYGATVCAERVAIWNGISQQHTLGVLNSSLKIKEILVISSSKEAWPPCGMCRQVIAEFGTEKTLVHIANVSGESKILTFAELFPYGFTPEYLK
jgi:cytidine deaminase